MKITVGKEQLIVQGMTPEENPWGAYQFPRPYRLADGRIAVAVHVEADDIKSFGKENRWFVSSDNGETFSETDSSIDAWCGTRLANGDLLYFPPESGFSVSSYREEKFANRTLGYDMKKRAEEGTLPLPDGVTAWWGGSTTIKAYNADRLPPSLAEKVWNAKLIKKGETAAQKIKVNVNWPSLTRVVFSSREFDNILKPIFPRGPVKRGPDGALWVTTFSGEGHINPANGQYSPYYSAELFRSDDEGMNWDMHAHMEYPADGNEYPYLSGGFSDSDIEFMPDGSMVWFFRSAWYGSTTYEWAPMYMSRSTDMGRSWSKPQKFAFTGILPRLCRLGCGTTLICYARPGIFIQATLDDSGTKWSDPVVVMTPEDRSHLANVKIENPTFHEWDGACNNPELLALDDHTAMLFYSDFYYPDAHGTKRKSILCRKITVSE